MYLVEHQALFLKSVLFPVSSSMGLVLCWEVSPPQTQQLRPETEEWPLRDKKIPY